MASDRLDWDTPPDIKDQLRAGGVRFQERGGWLRIQATWRGGKGFNVAVNPKSGGYIDFADGETTGSWFALCELLRIDHGYLKAPISTTPRRGLTADELKARQDEQAAIEAETTSRRINQARRFYGGDNGSVRRIEAMPWMDMLSKMFIDEKEANSQKRRRKGGTMDEPKDNLTQAEFGKALHYLRKRKFLGNHFAARAGAVVGKKILYGEEGAQAGGFEIRWPMWLDGERQNLNTIVAIQRERGRGHQDDGGHEQKQMLGATTGAGNLVCPKGPLGSKSNVLIIGEGAATCKAVWNHIDCHALIKFTAGAIAKLDIRKFGDFIGRAGITEIILLADHDPEKIHEGRQVGRTGQRACQAAAEAIRLVYPALAVKIATPPQVGDDWDDVESNHPDPGFFLEIFNASLADPAPPAPDPAPEGGQDSQEGRAGEGVKKPRQSQRGRRGGILTGQGRGMTGEIIPLAWTRPAENPTRPAVTKGMSLAEGERELQFTVANEIDWLGDEAGRRPVVIAATTGAGKSAAAAKAIAHSRRRGPVIFVTKLTEDKIDIAKKIEAEGRLTPHIHDGRNEQNCLKHSNVSALAEKGRSPFAWECRTCPHGTPDAAQPCIYMTRLRDSVFQDVIVATHAAVQDDSTLLKYSSIDGKTSKTRGIIIDEQVERVKPIDISADDISSARRMVTPAVAKYDAAIFRATQDLAQVWQQDEIKTINSRIADLTTARTWTLAIAPELDALALALAAANPAQRAKIDAGAFKNLCNLLTKTAKRGGIPLEAIKHDGTIIEDCSLSREQRMEIPISWLKSFGRALKEGTAEFYRGKITGGHTSKLWTKFLSEGGIMLDATPAARAIAEVKANNGRLHQIKIAMPMLSIIQHGPQLFGRGNLDKDKLDYYVKLLLREIEGSEVGDVAIITHKPIAKALLDKEPELTEFIDWWGRGERAHNRFESCKRLVIFGLNIANGDEAATRYDIDRIALAGAGVQWAEWGGEVSRQDWIEVDGGQEIRSAAPLPTVDDARAWLLDNIAADVAQAIGRLRAVRHTSPVQVDIFGAVPIAGHGIEIAAAGLAPGQAAQSAGRVEAIARAVEDINQIETPTHRKVADFVQRETGQRPSMSTIGRVIRSMRTAALDNKVSLDAMAERVITFIQGQQFIPFSTETTAAEAVQAAQAAKDLAARREWMATARLLRLIETERARQEPGAKRAGP